MPDILIYQANIGANSVTQPLDKDAPIQAWKFRRCPYAKGLYTIMGRHDGAAGGVRMSIQIGTTEVLQESALSAGGTDGVMPTPAGANAAPAHQFLADYNDEIVLTIKETGGVATSDVMLWVNVEPAA
ncbi:MAG TPA: hypothetical protein VNH14_14525 [Gemmatimonadales bacterium]|nr:hypothetical protein [Gemmatimonadales bacterium]